MPSASVVSIALQSLKARWKTTLVWSVGLFALALLFTGLHGSFVSDSEITIASLPENISAFIGDISRAADPAGWLGLQLYNIFLPLVAGAIGVTAGAAAIGKEEDANTLELLLASPISRGKILLQKAATIELQLLIITGALFVGVVVGSLVFTFDVSLLHVLLATVVGWLMGIVYGFLTLAMQAATGNRGLALSVGIAALIIGYFADALAQLFDWLEPLQYISPFYYYNGPAVLLDGLNSVNLIVLVGLSLVFYTIAHITFSRRDTGV